MWVILKRLRGALVRPSFIVAEPEPEQALSSRKLLLETFKFNVITAHSVPETLEMVKLFANCDALIVHCGLPGFDGGEAIKGVRTSAPNMPIIALTPTEQELKWADHVVHSHRPQELLQLVQELFGDPRKGFDNAGQGAPVR
jgi:CheY-like chemotaxis protein